MGVVRQRTPKARPPEHAPPPVAPPCLGATDEVAILNRLRALPFAALVTVIRNAGARADAGAGQHHDVPRGELLRKRCETILDVRAFARCGRHVASFQNTGSGTSS